MPYETTCPKGHRLQVSDSHLGQRIQCPACNESFVVPNGGRAAGAASPNLGGKSPAPWASADLARLSAGQAGRWSPWVCSSPCSPRAARRSIGTPRRERRSWPTRRPSSLTRTSNSASRSCKTKSTVSPRDVKPDERRADERKKDELRKQLRELQSTAAKDRRDKQAGDWDDECRRANRAADVRVEQLLARVCFLFAAGVLVLGLLIVSWSGGGAERRIGLATLAAVLYSIFAGRVAWGPLTAG